MCVPEEIMASYEFAWTPSDINSVIKRCHHKVPTVEEITYQLAGAKHLSKLDAKNGSVELD